MADEEKLFVIPIASLTRHIPTRVRSKYAMRAIRSYVAKHMKVDMEADSDERKNNIWVDPSVNEMVHTYGGGKIPRKIQVRAVKFDGGLVEVSPPEDSEGALKTARRRARSAAATVPAATPAPETAEAVAEPEPAAEPAEEAQHIAIAPEDDGDGNTDSAEKQKSVSNE